MQNTVFLGGVTLASSLIGMVVGVGSFEVFDAVALPQERRLILEHLSYENGLITQRHRVEGSAIIQATWAAEIVRGKQQLCSGGDRAPYEGGQKSFTPSAWTGDDCPDLLPGDIARASWEYKTTEGYLVSISGQIIIGKK